jgi:two-component system LytT family response regulator
MRGLIVDDEKASRQMLRHYLERYCPEVSVLAEAEDVDEAKQLADLHKPDLVFLDISMPRKDGFELLKMYDPVPFEVIFVTAFGEFAIPALRLSACDYLMKPINIDELTAAVLRARERIQKRDFEGNLRDLFHNLNGKGPKRIALAHSSGYQVVPVDEIIRFEADGRYTSVHIEGKSPLLVSRNLKEYESLLSELDFFRIHNSHLVNLKHVKAYQRGGVVVMTDNTKIEVSRKKRDDLLQKFGI